VVRACCGVKTGTGIRVVPGFGELQEDLPRERHGAPLSKDAGLCLRIVGVPYPAGERSPVVGCPPIPGSTHWAVDHSAHPCIATSCRKRADLPLCDICRSRQRAMARRRLGGGTSGSPTPRNCSQRATRLRTRWRCKSGSTPSKSMNGTSSLGEKMPIDSPSNCGAPMADSSAWLGNSSTLWRWNTQPQRPLGVSISSATIPSRGRMTSRCPLRLQSSWLRMRGNENGGFMANSARPAKRSTARVARGPAIG
jgi:hypothetical protein